MKKKNFEIVFCKPALHVMLMLHVITAGCPLQNSEFQSNNFSSCVFVNMTSSIMFSGIGTSLNPMIIYTDIQSYVCSVYQHI